MEIQKVISLLTIMILNFCTLDGICHGKVTLLAFQEKYQNQ